jgi:hypothetical protein
MRKRFHGLANPAQLESTREDVPVFEPGHTVAFD